MISKRKIFFAWQEKEEMKYIEEMSASGLKLQSVQLFKYNFIEDENRNRHYACDFRSFDKMQEDEYLQLYKDAGWAYSCKFGGWYYFYNEKEESFPLFSDVDSIKQKYKRLLIFLLLSGFPLYYSGLILMPALNLLDSFSFYSVFMIIIYPFMLIHMYALYKIFMIYKKYQVQLKE